MKCTYIGNFNEGHETTKKRCLIGPAMDKALTAIISNNISCEAFREIEANRLMKLDKKILMLINMINIYIENRKTYLYYYYSTS